MNIFRINTTPDEQYDFYIITTLSEEQIYEIIRPMIDAENEGDESISDNDEFIFALKHRFPLEIIELKLDIETLTF